MLATFGYDDLGRRTSLTRGNGTSTSYAYDPASRLSQLVQDLAGTGGDLTLGFSHNMAGQIVETERSNAAYSFEPANVARADTHDGLNQILQTGGVNVTHDARGNITNDGSRTYSYDSMNRLTHSGGPSNTWLYYDALGRILSIIPGGGDHDYPHHDGWTIVSEYSGSAVLRRRYVHGPAVDEPLVWYEGSGIADRRWLHADELGSIVALSSDAGAVANINAYDEYGVPEGTLTGRFGFTGQVWLPTIDIYYYRNRLYHPVLGRFMQTDPIGYAGGMNLYAYVSNDPVNLTDPLGLQNEDPRLPDKDNDQEIVVTGILCGSLSSVTCVRVVPADLITLIYFNPLDDLIGETLKNLGEIKRTLQCPVSAQSLDSYLRSKSSPLAGLGSSFLNAGRINDIDPRFIVALSGAETGFGREITWGRHNAWNWGWNSRNRSNSPFDSWESGMTSCSGST